MNETDKNENSLPEAPKQAPRSCVRTDDGAVHCGVVIEPPASPSAPAPAPEVTED
jgi:hypothetical protein